jgi:hypothetical protein
VEERYASPDMARGRLLAGVEAVAAGSLRSLQHCSGVRYREQIEDTQLAYPAGNVVEVVGYGVSLAAVPTSER